MAGDIKQRIVLEGEKEYKQALKDATRNLKTLRSELKAESAELGRNATEQQKNAVKAKNLQQQIREQEKAVKAHRDALEEVREKYGDNEEAIARYQQKLNEARATLANLKNELDAVGNSYDNVTNGAQRSILENNALAESFTRIGEAAGSIAGAIEGAFSGLLKTVKSTVGAIWGELMDIAAKSDNYMDLAAYFGSTATEVQKWDSAMKGAAGDLSTVTQLITKLKYSGKEKNIAEWFGISGENYTNDLEYFQAVMQQMVDNREKMQKAGTWDKAMADIFGTKKGFDVEGVLSDWDAILAGLQRFNADEGGYGLSEDQITKMADLNLQVQTLKESWEKLKEMATVHLFGDLAIRITGNLQNILDAFKDYLSADDPYAKKAALDSMKRNIREMFEAIRDAIRAGLEVLDELATEFENSDDPTSKTIGGLLRGIKNVIEWLADPSHWEDIKKGILIVLGVWLTSKLASISLAIGGIVKGLGTIAGLRGASGLFGGLFGGGANAAASGASAAASGGGTAAAAGGGTAAAKGGLFAKLGASGLGHAAVVGASGMLGVAAWTATMAAIVNNANAKANKAREVQADADRFNTMNTNQQRAITTAVTNLEKMTAGEGTGKELELLGVRLGEGILDAFNYTNTSGQQRNKLMDMLDMDDQNAAVAAMMLHAAGINTEQYQKFLEMKQNGSMDYAWGLATLKDFFNKSGYKDSNGNWLIKGYNPGSSSVSSGSAPNPWELSGYANTTNKPSELKNWKTGYWVGDDWRGMTEKYVNIDQNGGTWSHGVDSSWWGKQTETNQKISDMKVSIDRLPGEIGRSLSNVKIIMDKETVGYIIAQEVSQQIARDVPMLN